MDSSAPMDVSSSQSPMGAQSGGLHDATHNASITQQQAAPFMHSEQMGQQPAPAAAASSTSAPSSAAAAVGSSVPAAADDSHSEWDLVPHLSEEGKRVVEGMKLQQPPATSTEEQQGASSSSPTSPVDMQLEEDEAGVGASAQPQKEEDGLSVEERRLRDMVTKGAPTDGAAGGSSSTSASATPTVPAAPAPAPATASHSSFAAVKPDATTGEVTKTERPPVAEPKKDAMIIQHDAPSETVKAERPPPTLFRMECRTCGAIISFAYPSRLVHCAMCQSINAVSSSKVQLASVPLPALSLKSQAEQWSTHQVCVFLQSLNLKHVVPIFEKNHVDGMQLINLTYYDVRDILRIQIPADIESVLNCVSILRGEPVPTPDDPLRKAGMVGGAGAAGAGVGAGGSGVGSSGSSTSTSAQGSAARIAQAVPLATANLTLPHSPNETAAALPSAPSAHTPSSSSSTPLAPPSSSTAAPSSSTSPPAPDRVSDWRPVQVSVFLRKLRLDHLVPIVEAQQINGATFLNLDEQQMRQIGIEKQTDIDMLRQCVLLLRSTNIPAPRTVSPAAGAPMPAAPLMPAPTLAPAPVATSLPTTTPSLAVPTGTSMGASTSASGAATQVPPSISATAPTLAHLAPTVSAAVQALAPPPPTGAPMQVDSMFAGGAASAPDDAPVPIIAAPNIALHPPMPTPVLSPPATAGSSSSIVPVPPLTMSHMESAVAHPTLFSPPSVTSSVTPVPPSSGSHPFASPSPSPAVAHSVSTSVATLAPSPSTDASGPVFSPTYGMQMQDGGGSGSGGPVLSMPVGSQSQPLSQPISQSPDTTVATSMTQFEGSEMTAAQVTQEATPMTTVQEEAPVATIASAHNEDVEMQ